MSLIGIRNSGRRLQLRWSEHVPSTTNVPGNVAGAAHEPDSHDMRLMRVREALQRDGQPPEVRRAVEVVQRALAEGGVPRVARRQQWSVFNVPFMWAATAGDRSCAVLEWLAQSVRNVSIPVCGVEMPGHEAVMAGWEALHLAMNTMGVQSVEGLSEWIHGQRFPQHGGVVPTEVGEHKNGS